MLRVKVCTLLGFSFSLSTQLDRVLFQVIYIGQNYPCGDCISICMFFFLENKKDENYTNKKVSNKLALVSHAMNINFQSLSERNAPALKAIPPSIPPGTLGRI